ncbi:MAG TPA: group III truncated hemoglobin [Beijerinckiaceae bacterium]|jgi:hemoglobin|nr:group III truncated hemoglobin [Beijerinckiaceae bacterium]
MKGRPAPTRAMTIDGRLIPDALDEAMIHAVVHGFYDKIRSDDLLGPIFNGAIAPGDWSHHLAKMCDFWSSTLLRTGRYEGHPLRPHLVLPGLGEEHFRRWLTLFRATVQNLCPPDVAALFLDRALRIGHSFRLAIAFHRGENATQLQPILEESL